MWFQADLPDRHVAGHFLCLSSIPGLPLHERQSDSLCGAMVIHLALFEVLGDLMRSSGSCS